MAMQALLSIAAGLQEVLELVQVSSHRLYGSYERYAQGAADAWLNRIDGGLVRQVIGFFKEAENCQAAIASDSL